MIVLCEDKKRIVEVKELKIGKDLINVGLNDSAKLYLDLYNQCDDDFKKNLIVPEDAIFGALYTIVDENDNVLGKYFQQEDIIEIFENIVKNKKEYIILPKGEVDNE